MANRVSKLTIVGLALTLGAAPPAWAQGADVLRVGDALGAPSGEPTVGTRSPFSYMLSPIYDTLALVNADGSFTRQLGIEWRGVDATTWQYRLRPNVRFHNGEGLTAAGVAEYFTWLGTEPALATSVGPTTRQLRLDTVRAVDELTLEIKTKGANPILPQLLQGFWIPAPKAWAEGGKEAFARKPVGSGSFRVTEWAPNGTEYEAFAESWRAPRVARRSFSVGARPDGAALGRDLGPARHRPGHGHGRHSGDRERRPPRRFRAAATGRDLEGVQRLARHAVQGQARAPGRQSRHRPRRVRRAHLP
jgi:peptide/nickel transport system substrate-binding protein